MFVVKECNKCNEYKLLSFFSKGKTLFGVKNNCKECDNRNYIDNKEKVKERVKNYSKNNKEKISQYQAVYKNKNNEKLRLENKKYRINNRDKIKLYNKNLYNKKKDALAIHRKKHYIENKSEYSKRSKIYYEKNKLKIYKYIKEKRENDFLFNLKHKISCLIRVSIKGRGYTKKSRTHEILGCDYEMFKLYVESQFKKGMSWDNHGEWHLDHIYPVSLAKDEQHLIELNHYTNFQPLWAKDNISKGNKLIEKQLFLL